MKTTKSFFQPLRRAAKLALPVAGLLTGLSMTSCSEDDSVDPDPQPTEKPFVLSLAIQGSEGDFTYYTVPFEDVMSGSLSAAGQGIEQPGYFDFKKIDNTIYSMGGLDDINVVGITRDENGELVQTGDVSYDNGLEDIVMADDNTLVAVSMSSDSDVVTFHTLDPNSVTAISSESRPASDLTEVDGASYSGMRIEDNRLFLSYYISDPETFATNHTDLARVAVYSYPEFEFQEIITDERVGPIGGFNTKSGLIEDENGNIYAVSHSNPANGFSKFTNDSGILRINSGEATFDTDYFFDVEEAAGGTVAHLKYLGNGKAFAEINTSPREEQGTWSDSPLQSAIIDLNTHTVDFIDGIPEHNGSGRRLAALHDNGFVYMTIPDDNRVFVYRINTTDYTATRGAEVEANFVAGFFKL